MPWVRDFSLPDLGEGLTEAEIVRWLVRVGDLVAVDDPVVEVETAKATLELPCPYAGVVSHLHGAEGQVMDVGRPLIAVTVDDSTAASGSGGGGSGNVLVGYGTRETPRRRGVLGVAADPAGASAGASAGSASGVGPVPVISPLVRKLAGQHGLDLRRLRGSGPGGLILRTDVDEAVRESARTTAGSTVHERIPLRGRQAAAAEKFTRSRREIPDATCWVEADATALVGAKAVLAAQEGTAIGLLALLARICVVGLARFPQLNASVDTERGEIVRWSAVNLGFAAQTGRGLAVPVVPDAHLLSTGRLAAELTRLTAAARDGSLSRADLSGGTFTLNNYGVFGVDGSTPILNHPEAAMLGVGRIIDKPWVHDGALAVRKTVQLSFTFDHRVCDGAEAGGFLRFVADCVEQPLRLLREL